MNQNQALQLGCDCDCQREFRVSKSKVKVYIPSLFQNRYAIFHSLFSTLIRIDSILSLSLSLIRNMAESVELPSRLAILPFRNKVLLPGAIIRIRCTSPSRYFFMLLENCVDFSNANFRAQIVFSILYNGVCFVW